MGDETSVGLDEAFTFLANRVETEEEDYGRDIPDHGVEMVVTDAAELLETVTSIEMSYIMADEDGIDEAKEEQFDEALVDDLVDIVASLATVQYERDVDIAEGIKDRIQFIKDYAEFEEAVRSADGDEAKMEAVDEYMTEEIAKEMGVPEEDSSPTIGENVDADDYDPDHVGSAFQ